MTGIRTIPHWAGALLALLVVVAVAFGGPLHQADPHHADGEGGDPGPCLICKLTEHHSGPATPGPVLVLPTERHETRTPETREVPSLRTALSPAGPRAPPRSV